MFFIIENQSVISKYKIIDATDAEVIPVETDGKEYIGVVENKIDTPFIIVIPDTGTFYIKEK